MIKQILNFFDKLEDQVRGHLSRYPIRYAFIGGTAVVLFWRGIWHLADDLGVGSIESIILGALVLLMTGLFSSVFIGDQIIISGLKHGKKVSDITAEEVKTELDVLSDLEKEVKELHQEVHKKEDKEEFK